MHGYGLCTFQIQSRSERAPVFDVFGAAANGSHDAHGRPRLSHDTLPVRGMQVLRSLQSEVDMCKRRSGRVRVQWVRTGRTGLNMSPPLCQVSQLWGRLSASGFGWEEQLTQLAALRNGFCLGNQSVLVRLRETLAELDAWKAQEPSWLEQGRAMGLRLAAPFVCDFGVGLLSFFLVLV